MNCLKGMIFGAALCAAAVATVPSAASAQSSFRSYRCADGSQFMVGFFQYDKRAHLQLDGKALTLPRRWTLSQTGGADGVALSGEGRDAPDHQSGGRDAQACQAEDHDLRAADMKKGRNVIVPTLFGSPSAPY